MNKQIIFYLVALVGLIFSGCFNRTRFNNFNWQLDSLKYYTIKTDSLLKLQQKELDQLRTDLYQKSNELSDKIEMLNSRFSDTEFRLNRIYERLGPQKAARPDTESQVNPEARLIYESAYMSYVKGNYKEAIDGFKSYLKLIPESSLADNALYWIGESYYALGKLQKAADTFLQLINKYSESNKIPSAYYKLGIIYETGGKKKTATYYYTKLVKEFPNSPEASLAREKLK